jgi:O-antigen ligase
VVVILILIGLANVAWFSPLLEGLLVLRPLIVLLLATLVAYWTSLRYGTQAPLLALVVAGMLAIPGGFYNSAAGDLSYYDASFVYLIGMAAILVFFRVVDVGLLRIPFMLLALVVIVFSTRRGATLVVAIAFLITALVVSRGRVRAVTAAALAAVVVVELVAPDLVLSRAEDLAGYFAGTSGERAVDARNWESANAWENIRRNWAFGIGPTAHWALYDTVGGNFRLSEEFRSYLHNSYQWVWLRFGLIGLLAYVAFFLVSARTLLRRQAPRVAIIVGGSVVGAAVGVVTASFLTTTTRWPLTVGLLLGVALAALHAERSPRLAG